ncbi:MAG: hypothetical protein B7Z81_08125 [Acidocella sp. 20-61-6]|nr:MAG: hypothetical protein B7Z81_08125 [Acidocella sp. 20-61-6]
MALFAIALRAKDFLWATRIRNAPFHNKPKIAEMLTEHGHKLLPLSRYSPDFNPIEKAFAILKRQRIFSGKSVHELMASHF